MGKKIRFTVALMAALLVCSCSKKSSNSDDRHHPQVHFSCDKNWTGEPAGLVYLDGEYHLFFQYNPNQASLGNICWGHAVSRDLVHWEKLPVAITEDTLGQIYSGSVAADLNNSSGLGSTEKPPLVAFYTYHDSKSLSEAKPEHSIALAYSLDKGRSWTKLNNPVLKNSETPVFRNPNVSWNKLTQKWLMTVSVGSAIQLYTSPDCLHWSYLSEFGGSLTTEGGWESSDLFPVKVANSDVTKWVLLVSMNGGPADGAPAIRYFVGDFDGTEFKMTQTKELWADYGRDNYAALIFNNAPDERIVMLGWMSSWNYANQTPTKTWRGSMTFPRELSLVEESNYYLLASEPVKELNSFAIKTDSVKYLSFSDEKRIFDSRIFPQKPFVLKLVFDTSNRFAIWNAQDYGVSFKTRSGKKLSIGYKADMRFFYIDRSNLLLNPFSDYFGLPMGATYAFNNQTMDWSILVDGSSVELFACGNRVAMTSLFYSDEAFESFELYSKSGSTKLSKVYLTEF